MLNKTLIGFRSCKRAFFIRQLAALGGGCPPVGPVALRRPLSRVVLLTWEEPHPYFIGKVHKMLWGFVSFSSTEPIFCFPAHVRPDFMRDGRIIIHPHIGPRSVACQKTKAVGKQVVRLPKILRSACVEYAGKRSSGSWLPSAETAIRPCSFATPAFAGCAVNVEFTFACYINYHILFRLSSDLCNNIHFRIQTGFHAFLQANAAPFQRPSALSASPEPQSKP